MSITSHESSGCESSSGEPGSGEYSVADLRDVVGSVDGLPATFYALVVSHCVWDPSAMAPLQDTIHPFLPKL